MRITNNLINEIVDNNIETCLEDLKDQGIDIDSDKIKIEKAAELYCKWQMNYNGEAERFERHYNAMRDQMSMQQNYKSKEIPHERRL